MSPSTSLNFNDNVGRSGALIVVFKLRDDGSVLLQFSEPHYPIRDTRYYILELSWFRKIGENYSGQGWTTAKAICKLETGAARQAPARNFGSDKGSPAQERKLPETTEI
jgi:hypothetical protein